MRSVASVDVIRKLRSPIAIVCQSLRHMGLSSILIVVQLFFGFLSLLLAIGLFFGINSFANQVQFLMPNNTLSINVDISTHAMDGNRTSYRKLLALKQKIAQLNDVAGIGMYDLSSSFGFTQAPENEVGKLPMSQFSTQPIALVSNTFVQHMKVATQGEPLSAITHFSRKNSKVFPIWVGSALASQYPLGTRLIAMTYYTPPVGSTAEATVDEMPCQVVGIISSDAEFFANNGANLGAFSLQSCTNLILGPVSMFMWNKKSSEANLILSDNMQVYPLPGKEAELKANIYAILHQRKMHGMVHSVEDQLNALAKQQKPSIVSTFLVAVSLLSLSVLGHISVLLSSLIKRRKEFGIRLLIGARKASLLQLVMAEILGLYVLALILSLGIMLNLSDWLDKWLVVINLPTILLAVGITLFLSLLASIIPLRRLSRQTTVRLIQGE